MKVKFATQTIRQIEHCCEEMKKAEEGRAIIFPMGWEPEVRLDLRPTQSQTRGSPTAV